MTDNLILPIEIEQPIKEFIEIKLKELNLEKYINEPIKDRVLDLLDTLCIVVYYPLPGEDNNGFHITDMPFANGSKQHFVYINTAQTMEKQVFTAAHELGHLWEIDNYILEKLPELNLDNSEDGREAIISRFAAILLMPKDIFLKRWEEECKKNVEEKVSILSFIKIIVILMDDFFAPVKSIVLRFFELGIIDQTIVDFLLNGSEKEKEKMKAVFRKFIADYGLVQFLNPTNKKWIDGFAAKLDEAEEKDLVSKTKIKELRKRFGFGSNKIITDFNDEISIKKQEG